MIIPRLYAIGLDAFPFRGHFPVVEMFVLPINSVWNYNAAHCLGLCGHVHRDPRTCSLS